jgi:ribosomal protein S18 acetylase RimI-like enzyme
MRFFRSLHRVAAAQPGEAAALARLYAEAWSACAGHIDERMLRDQMPGESEVRTWFSGGFEIYRTLHEGVPDGVVRLSFPSGTCHLDHLAVAPALRRQGRGRSLLEHAAGRARRTGATRIWAQTSPRLEETVAFFRNFGFRTASEHLAPYWGERVLLLEMPI